MKKINTLFLSLLFLSTVILSNQLKAQSCPWAYKAGGISEDFGAAVATDASGNVYYLGNFYSQNITFGTTVLHNLEYTSFNKGADLFLVKYDSCGNLIWAKQAGGDNNAQGNCITTDAIGNIYIGGTFSCDTLHLGTVNLVNVGGSTNAFVAKYNSSGIAQWAVGGSGNAQNYVRAIALDASNNVYATGYFGSDVLTFGSNSVNNGAGSGISNMFVAKFDNSGNNLWLRGNLSNGDFGNAGNAIGYGIGVDGAGNVYAGGTFESTYIRFGTDSLPTAGFYDIFLIKYNTGGTLQWLKTAGGTDDDEAFGLATDATGNSYITGQIGASTTATFGTQSITNTNNSRTMFIAKYDNAGNALWARGSKSDDFTQNQGYSVTLDALGNPNVIGYYNSDSLVLGALTVYNNSNTTLGGMDSDSMDVFVAKYKTNGTLSWARTAGGTGNDYGYGIAAGPHNSLYICGEFDSPTISFPGTTFSVTAGSGAGLGDAFIVSNISTSLVTPSICEVSTDSVAINNYIYWDNTYNNVSKYIVYREILTGKYLPIGMVSRDSLSQFIDIARSINNIAGVNGSNGDPNSGTQRYKLQILDTAGTYSMLSPYHNTIFIQQGTNGAFSWVTNYSIEGMTLSPVSNYILTCDTANTGAWVQVASQSGSSQTIVDPGFIHHATIANWRVDGLGFNCNPSARLSGNNSVDAARVKSHSNTNNNRTAGINKVVGTNQLISVYPNPNNGSFVIETNATEKQTVQLFDVTGKLVLTQSLIGKTTIDAGSLNEGVYNISITGSAGMVNKRMVIVR